MNRLSSEDRARILHLLCEGSGIRAITRLTRASKNTVAKLLVDAGKACAAYHDEYVRNVKVARVQVDEIWSFTYSKQKNVAGARSLGLPRLSRLDSPLHFKLTHYREASAGAG